MEISQPQTHDKVALRWSATRRGQVVIAIAMLGLFGLVFWLATQTRRILSATGPLVCDPQDLDLGTVWDDPAFVHSLHLRNPTKEEIVVDDFAADCQCVKIEPRSLTISPGGVGSVNLTLDLRGRTVELPDASTREFHVSIKPKLRKGSKEHPGWTILGKVKRAFDIHPQVVDFEESMVRGQPFPNKFAQITCRFDAADLSAHSDMPFIKTKIRRDQEMPRRFHLEVEPANEIPLGDFRYSVQIRATAADNSTVHGIVPIVGRVLQDVYVIPDLLAFGAVPVGSPIKQTVTLRSRSACDFTIESIGGLDSDEMKIEERRKLKDGGQTLGLSGMVLRTGYQESKISIKVKTRQGELLDLSLRCNYLGYSAKREDNQ